MNGWCGFHVKSGVPDRLDAGHAFGALRMSREKGTEDLLSGGFGANDFVALDDRGNANSSGAIFRPFVDPNHFAHRANENFRTAGHFGGQSERNVKFGSRARDPDQL